MFTGRRGWLWFGAGLLLAITAGLVAFISLQRAAKAPGPAEELRARALVASRDIPVRSLIGADDVVLRDFPATALPAGGLTSLDDAIGKLSTVDIAKGEIIVSQRLLAPDYVGPRVAAVMDPKKVLVAFPANDLLSSVDVIRAGDRVDLMFSVDPTKGHPQITTDMATVSGLQDVEVASVIYATPTDQQKKENRTPARAILLAVDPQDALTIKHFCDAGASPDLALRSPAAARGPFEVTPVDSEYILQRYQVHWWARQ